MVLATSDRPADRIVARFRTDPEEVRAAASALTPTGVTIGKGWTKRGLLVLGLAIGAGWALGSPYWPPGWTAPVTTAALSFVLGGIAAIALNVLLFRRQQRLLTAMAREAEVVEVTVSCGERSIVWATPAISHSLNYADIDAATELNNVVLIRYKLFVLHIPARGFSTSGDKGYLLDTLRRHVAPDRLTGLTVPQG